MNTALRGVRVTVAPDDAEAAREILAESELESPTDPSTDEMCPSCRSERFGPPGWKKRIKALAIFFFPILLLYPVILAFSRRNECYACGHKWNPKPEN